MLGRCSAIVYMGEDFCDFLFALLHIKPLLKTKEINLLPLEQTPFQKGPKSIMAEWST